MIELRKYPRTPHVEGSRLQPGDEDLASVPFARLAGRHVVVEEKVDGANAGISFDADGRLWLQSRGHVLTGGPRERHFDLFKTWASCFQASLFERLGSRYVLYGEWLYAKHTAFYDALPHYFLEFDLLDMERGVFLSTDRRRALLDGLPLASVPVLREGEIASVKELQGLLGPSRFKSPDWMEQLHVACTAKGVPFEQAWRESDPSELMEGLYLKVEEHGEVVERYKFVRASFSALLDQPGSHWLDRPIIPNQLRAGVDLFGGGA